MLNRTTFTIQETFDHLLKVISSDKFLKMKGLGNEVPFFICPFQPSEFSPMMKIYENLVSNLKNKGIQILEINLYDLTIDILRSKGVWDKVLENEKSLSKDEMKELLQGMLDPEKHLIPEICKKIAEDEYDVMFIIGVGEVFPYIRSHTVLNNLQSIAKDKPTILFFPGEYKQSIEEGDSLKLFDRLPDDKYYRAFNIFHFQV